MITVKFGMHIFCYFAFSQAADFRDDQIIKYTEETDAINTKKSADWNIHAG